MMISWRQWLQRLLRYFVKKDFLKKCSSLWQINTQLSDYFFLTCSTFFVILKRQPGGWHDIQNDSCDFLSRNQFPYVADWTHLKKPLPRNVTPNASENMLTILNVLMLSCRLFKQVLYCPYRLYLLLSYWLLEYSHSDPIPQHFCLQFKFFLAQI